MHSSRTLPSRLFLPCCEERSICSNYEDRIQVAGSFGECYVHLISDTLLHPTSRSKMNVDFIVHDSERGWQMFGDVFLEQICCGSDAASGVIRNSVSGNLRNVSGDFFAIKDIEELGPNFWWIAGGGTQLLCST